MKTTQLRRYAIEPGKMSAFVAWFEAEIPSLRRAFGFEIDFYLATNEDEFLWAVTLDGDMDEFLRVEAEYSVSNAREAAFQTYPNCITNKHISFVV